MADETQWADHNPLIGPSRGGAAERERVPERSWGEAAIDPLLNLGAGIVGAVRQVQGVNEAARTAIDPRGPQTATARKNMDTLADIEGWIKSGRSAQEQEAERTGGYSFSKDPGKYLAGAAVGMLPYAPLALLGPWGVPVAGAMGFGQVRSDERENIRNAPIEAMRKNPQWVDLIDQGMSDDDAREQIYRDATDPTKGQTYLNALPNVVGQAATSGFGSALVKGIRGLKPAATPGAAGVTLTAPGMRNTANEILTRVMDASNKNWMTGRATGLGMGAATGATMGAGANLSKQLSAQTSGMQTTPTDWGEVGESAGESSALFAGLGVLGHRRGALSKAALERAAARRAPPVGTHLDAAAGGYKPAGIEGGYDYGDMGTPPGHEGGMGFEDMPGERPGPGPPPGGTPPPTRAPFDVPEPGAERPPGYDPSKPGGGLPPEEPRPAAPPEPEYGGFGTPEEPLDPRFHPMEPFDPRDVGEPHVEEAAPAARAAPAAKAAPKPWYATGKPGDRLPRSKGPRVTSALFGEPEMSGALARGTDLTQMPLDEAAAVHPERTAMSPQERAAEEQRVRDMQAEQPEARAAREQLQRTAEEETGAHVPTERRAPKFAETGAPDLPGTGDFPHEQSGASWHGGIAQRVIADHLRKASPSTRGQIAAMLTRLRDAGQKLHVGALPEAVQKTLAKIRNTVDRALEYNADGTIDAIRGDAVALEGGVGPDAKRAIDNIRTVHGDEVAKTWGEALARRLEKQNVVPFLQLHEGLRDALNETNHKIVMDAVRHNPHAVADALQGIRRDADGPVQYVRRGELSRERKEQVKKPPPTGELPDEIAFEEQQAEGPVDPTASRERKVSFGEEKAGGTLVIPRAPPPPRTVLSLPSRKARGATAQPETKRRGKAKRERMDLPEALQAILDKVAASKEERRKVAEKITGSFYNETTGKWEKRSVRRINVVETGVVPGERTKSQLARAADIAERERNEMAGTLDQRQREAQREMLAAQQDEAARKALLDSLEEYDKWVASQLKDAPRAELQEFKDTLDAVERDTKDAIAQVRENATAEAKEKKKDVDRVNIKRDSDYRVRDIISKALVTIGRGSKDRLKAAVDLLNRVLTGGKIERIDDEMGHAPEGQLIETYLTPTGTARGERITPEDTELKAKEERRLIKAWAAWEKAFEKWEAEGGAESGREMPLQPKTRLGSAALDQHFEPFLNLPMRELQLVAKEFVRLAMARVNAANAAFERASINLKNTDGRFWSIGTKVGNQRYDRGIYYNQLVDDRIFAASALRYMGHAKPGKLKHEGGNHRMLQALVLNHWMSQKLALEGNSRKMVQFYRERADMLREEMLEKYHFLSATSGPGEKLALDANLKKAMEILEEDAKRASTSMEVFRDITNTPPLDIWQQFDEHGLGHLMPDGDVPSTALKIFSNFMSNDIREQYERRAVRDARRAERPAGERLDELMWNMHGEGWLGATPEAKAQLLAEYEQFQVHEYGPVSNRPAADRPIPAEEHGREGVPGDLVSGLQEELRFIDGLTRKGTGPHAERPLSPEARALRVTKLMELADRIIDRIEALPAGVVHPKLENELHLIEAEVRAHYEAAVPGARGTEYGTGRVLEPGSDLSRPTNLPKGAYVRRVSDFLKEGARDIRSAVGDMGTGLRNHLLRIAERTVGDMEVVALKTEQMALAAQDKGLPVDTPAFYDPMSHRILIRQDVLRGPERNRILGHEISHPLTLHAAAMFPEIRRRLQEQHAELVRVYHDLRDPRGDAVRAALDGNTQALDNIHEMIGELYNDGGRVAAALHAIETTPAQRARWKSAGLWDGFAMVRQIIRQGLNKLLFQNSKKRLLNDVTLNSLDLLHSLDDAGFERRSSRREVMPYTPKEPISKKEQELWSAYRVRNVDHVLSRGENFEKYEQRASSYAVAEDGQIHDVKLHEHHAMRVAEARGLDPDRAMSLTGESYFNEEGKTFRPWVHISKFYNSDGASLGINRSSEMTAAQAAVVRQIASAVTKAQRSGERIELDGVDGFRNRSDLRFAPHDERVRREAEWQRRIERTTADLPPVREGHVRLFRVEVPAHERKEASGWLADALVHSGAKDAAGRWFATDPTELAWYARHAEENGAGSVLSHVDVPLAEAERYRVAGMKAEGVVNPGQFSRRPEAEYFVSKDVAARTKQADIADERLSAPFPHRSVQYRNLMDMKSAGAEVRSATSFVQRMIDFGSTEHTAILRAIKPLLDGAEVHIFPEMKFPAGVEFYDPVTHRVYLKDATMPRTQVHELLHAATARALNYHPELRAAFDRIIEEVKRNAQFKRFMKDEPAIKGYFTKSADEFVAEFYSNKKVRDLLNRMQAPPALLRDLKIMGGKKSFMRVMTDLISKWLNRSARDRGTVGELSAKLIEDVLKAQGELPAVNARQRYNEAFADLRRYEAPHTMDEATSRASEMWKNTKFRLEHLGISGGLNNLRTFHQLTKLVDDGMRRVTAAVEDVWSQVETTAKTLFRDSGGEDIVREIANQMRMAPGHFQTWSNYVADEAQWRVTGSDPLYRGRNEWVSKTSPYHQHYRDRHAEMERRWNDLTADQQAAHRRMLDYYDKTHRDDLTTNIRTLVRMRDMVPGDDPATIEAVMKHILREDLTDADRRLLENTGWRSEIDQTDKSAKHLEFANNVREIRGIPAFKKIEGAWHPAFRRGNWVVEGRYDLTGHAERFGGRRLDERGAEWEFPTEKQAQDFYAAVTGDPALNRLHHQGTTKVVYKADAAGNPMLGADGHPIYETEFSERTTRRGERADDDAANKTPFTETTVGVQRRVTAKEAEGEAGTVTRHRVEFNPLLLEFYENPRHAWERHQELQGDSALKLSEVEPKRVNAETYLTPQKSSRALNAMITSLKNGKGWRDMDATTRALTERDLTEAAVRHIMSTSARSALIPKRYALGANKEIQRNFTDYARHHSMRQAELQHRPDLSRAVEAMDEHVTAMKHHASPNDPQGTYGTQRRNLQREIHKRIFTRPDELVAPFWSKAIARVLQLSYLDKLMSPGFIVLNATEPWVLGAPLLAGRHGFAAYGEIGKAYGAIGFAGVWGKGFINAYRAAREGVMAKMDDNHKLLIDRIRNETDAGNLTKLFNHMQERGYLDRDAGMELAQRVDASTTALGKGLDHLDNVSRQINAQIENVNRAVVAIAAYRLGREKGGMTHEQAMAHAVDTVHDVSGNYQHWNSPAMFSDPRFKFALQFKRYAQRITSNYARMIVNSWAGQTPEIRSASRQQLMYMLGSQQLLSGALGLPLEPLKLVLLATSPVTGFGPDEAEVAAREGMAKLVGDPQMAEAIMRGGIRAYLDIGIGTRLGHDSLWTHGTLGKKPEDWWSTVGHAVGGAPGGMLMDWAMAGKKAADSAINYARGYHTEAGADLSDALQLGLPFKLVSDTIGAAQNYLGGHKTRTPGGQSLGYDPTFGQAVLEGAGIRSGTAQEASDKRFALTQAKARYSQGRTEALQRYARASTPAEKRAIEENALRNFNPQWPEAMRLSHNDFYKAQRRYDLRQSADPGDVGVMLSKRQAGLRDRFSFYNN